jgi:hypothetical protein
MVCVCPHTLYLSTIACYDAEFPQAQGMLLFSVESSRSRAGAWLQHICFILEGCLSLALVVIVIIHCRNSPIKNRVVLKPRLGFIALRQQ